MAMTIPGTQEQQQRLQHSIENNSRTYMGGDWGVGELGLRVLVNVSGN